MQIDEINNNKNTTPTVPSNTAPFPRTDPMEKLEDTVASVVTDLTIQFKNPYVSYKAGTHQLIILSLNICKNLNFDIYI